MHKLGYDLECTLKCFNKYKQFNDIKYDLIKNIKDIFKITEYYDIDVTMIQSDRLVIIYQVYLIRYLDRNIESRYLTEYFAEGFKVFCLAPCLLEKRDLQLYNFIKEMI